MCRDGVLYVAQAGVKLLSSSDPPALASQRAGIAGVSLNFKVNFSTCKIVEWYLNILFPFLRTMHDLISVTECSPAK